MPREWLQRQPEVLRDPSLAEEVRLLAEDQAEFDEQIKNLTKLLVDALNEESIQAELPTRVKDERSIGKLTRWLERARQPNAGQHIEFLRKLQAIRSKSAAHGKGSDYEKLMRRLGYLGRPLSAVFDEILTEAAAMIDDLREWAGLDAKTKP